MNKMKASYHISTPMFISPDNKGADLRPPSIKGALRFWYRAYKYYTLFLENKNTALEKLHKSESELWGSTSNVEDGKETGGQGKVILRLRAFQGITSKELSYAKSVSYLLGQGLYHFKDGLVREYLPSGGAFHLDLILKNRITSQEIKDLENTLLLMGMLGGLGSRARRGFGSVSIQSLTTNEEKRDVPRDPEHFKQILSDIFPDISKKEKVLHPFTAFSARTKIDISAIGDKEADVLKIVNDEMQMYRSWGREGMVNGRGAERNFKEDHDNSLKVIQNTAIAKDFIPKRSLFGLPHGYFFGSLKKGVIWQQDKGERRASPLFIHIHKFPGGKYAAVQSLLEAKFLPDGVKVSAGNHKVAFNDSLLNYGVIHKYLKRFEKNEGYQGII